MRYFPHSWVPDAWHGVGLNAGLNEAQWLFLFTIAVVLMGSTMGPFIGRVLCAVHRTIFTGIKYVIGSIFNKILDKLVEIILISLLIWLFGEPALKLIMFFS